MLSGPTRAPDWREPDRDLGFAYFDEPDREHGSAALCRHEDATAKAGTAGVEPLQPVDGWEMGLGIVR